MIRVALVDDHTLVREGFRQLLSLEPDLDVVAEHDRVEALAASDLHDCDVAIVDIALRGKKTGLSFIRDVLTPARIPSIVLTMYDREPYVSEAFAAGALGYVSKHAGPSELIESIRKVMSGRRFLSRDIARPVSERPGHASSPFAALSPREAEICRLLVLAMEPKRIASKLDIQPKTVYAHKYSIFEKLGVQRPQDLVALAFEHGFVRQSDISQP